MTKIRGQIKSIWPDRTQYKPYAYNLEMDNVWLEIEIDEDNVKSVNIEGGVKEYTLDLDGFTCLLSTIADAIDKMHLSSLQAKNRKGDF